MGLLRGSAGGLAVAGGFASNLLRELINHDDGERAANTAIKLGVVGLSPS